MKKKILMIIGLIIIITLCFTIYIKKENNKIKYVFLFIGDGMSLPQVDATEIYNNCVKKNSMNNQEQLSFTEFETIGLRKNHSKLSWIVSDLIVGAGKMESFDALDDMTPYYLIKKDGLKLLVNIHDYILEVIELPENTNDKKFVYGNNIFKQFKKI